MFAVDLAGEGVAVSKPASPDVSTAHPTAAGPAADSTAVTITVQITVPNDVLPQAAHRLISDLKALSETAVELSGPLVTR